MVIVVPVDVNPENVILKCLLAGKNGAGKVRLQTLCRRVALPVNECLRRTVQIAMPSYGYKSMIGISFGILSLMTG
ncbi:hypothetical protein [Paraburkholderia fungorum]|uniref:Uncharacterized protein n=1 Tax=Paraburkholderia fungorum TaxID=134537 RepID=A0A3R7LD59_9BURK|nr:hypothetical protein [Paraburkholderia fungorum]RKF50714.1 hypothetical protein BCY88_00600 [Paraburkholderia fungorum]